MEAGDDRAFNYHFSIARLARSVKRSSLCVVQKSSGASSRTGDPNSTLRFPQPEDWQQFPAARETGALDWRDHSRAYLILRNPL